MFKRFFPYVFHIILAAVGITAAYFLLKPHYKTTGLTIGLISMERVREQAQPFQQLTKLVNEANTKAQERIQTLEKELRKEYGEFQVMQQKKNVKSENLAKRKEALDKKVAEIDQEFQHERDALNQKFGKIHMEIEAKLAEIIHQYHKEHQIDLFLNTSTDKQLVALVADDQLNHTDAIIAQLNESIPDIQKIGK